MKPAPFAYHAPTSVPEAVDLLSRHAGRARVLAGGQSLLPLLSTRALSPENLVDINRVGELAFVRAGPDGLAVGALTRQSAVVADGRIRDGWPLLCTATGRIGHPAIRNRGTIGGSLAHADPSAELPAVAVALDARVVVRGARGHREIDAATLFRGRFTTDLALDELLTEVRFPPAIDGSGQAWVEHARRHNDAALVGVAAVVSLDDRFRCSQVRVVCSGVHDVPFDAVDVREVLVGEALDERSVAEAGRRAAEGCRPGEDARASARYRRHLVARLTARALAAAGDRARAGGVRA